MRLFRPLAAVAVLAIGLSGCVISDDINSITASLSTPAATQAAANLKAGATALLCTISNVSAVAQGLNAQVKAGTVMVRDTNTVYIVSSTLCASLGGTVTGSATVPAP